MENSLGLVKRLGGLWYMASPYTILAPNLDRAAELAASGAAELVRAGVNAYSPIVHSHALVKAGELDNCVNYEDWMTLDFQYLDQCTGMIVLGLPGWLRSKGVRREYIRNEANGKPCFLMTPFLVDSLAPLYLPSVEL